jgi:hypothetical protein
MAQHGVRTRGPDEAGWRRAKADLAASRRKEELRAKEKMASSQIGGLEGEVARLAKALDASRASYSSLSW